MKIKKSLSGGLIGLIFAYQSFAMTPNFDKVKKVEDNSGKVKVELFEHLQVAPDNEAKEENNNKLSVEESNNFNVIPKELIREIILYAGLKVAYNLSACGRDYYEVFYNLLNSAKNEDGKTINGEWENKKQVTIFRFKNNFKISSEILKNLLDITKQEYYIALYLSFQNLKNSCKVLANTIVEELKTNKYIFIILSSSFAWERFDEKEASDSELIRKISINTEKGVEKLGALRVLKKSSVENLSN